MVHVTHGRGHTLEHTRFSLRAPSGRVSQRCDGGCHREQDREKGTPEQLPLPCVRRAWVQQLQACIAAADKADKADKEEEEEEEEEGTACGSCDGNVTAEAAAMPRLPELRVFLPTDGWLVRDLLVLRARCMLQHLLTVLTSVCFTALCFTSL